MKSDKTIPLRQLVTAGWRRFWILIIVMSALIQVFVLAVLSVVGFAAFDSGAGPERQWRYSAETSHWVYKYPAEPIVIPLDKYAEHRIVVGTRIVGMPYFESVHGEGIKSTPIGSLGLLAINYTPSENQQVYQFVEDRIGFPFVAMRSTFVMESTNLPSVSAGVQWRAIHGIKITGESGPSSLPLPREFVAIPLSPIYHGLLLNTLIYAIPVAILILLLRMSRLARACKRKHQGKCVACSYPDSESSHCPECGLDTQVDWKKALWAGSKLHRLPRIRE